MTDRKSPVRWTSHESTLIAIEAEKIGLDPDAPAHRTGNGSIARSLASRVIIAQQILPAHRRKSPGGIHTMANLDGWYRSSLRNRELYAPQPDRIAKPTPLPATPANPNRDALELLLALVRTTLSDAVDQGVTRALARYRQEDEEHVRHNPRSPQDALTKARRRIDVIGLHKGGQVELVERAPEAEGFDIRFLPADQKVQDPRPDVIVCTKFMSHNRINEYRSSHSRVHYANGGPQSVIVELGKMRNGSGVQH